MILKLPCGITAYVFSHLIIENIPHATKNLFSFVFCALQILP